MHISPRIQRALLAIPVTYQLLVVLITPNTQNIIGAKAYPFIAGYARNLEFAGTWTFFAPDPGPPPLALEWELLDKSGQPTSRGKMPEEEVNPFFFADRQARRAGAVRFMLMTDGLTEKMMVPYLCKSHPEANSVRLWSTVYPVPTMEDIASGKRSLRDHKDLERKEISLSFCRSSL
jgi:hypothetical protein